MRKERAIIVDDDQAYRKLVKDCLENIGFIVGEFETDNSEEAKAFAPGATLIVLDNRYEGKGSYWRDLIVALRRNHPEATILLVSHYDDAELEKDVNDIDPAAKAVLQTDPYITYLPKGVTDNSPGPHLTNFCQELFDRIRARRKLQATLIQCALEAARRLLQYPLCELMKKASPSPEKTDTLFMDIVAEQRIKEFFVPEMHYNNVVICTEEAGVHNDLYHRIAAPRFFVFSDPFDGSSAFKAFAIQLCELGYQNSTLPDVLKDCSLISIWEKKYGAASMNAPMVSMVLAERHRIVGAILVNLFTSHVYVSIDSGNYFTSLPRLEGPSEDVIKSIKQGGIIDDKGWKKLEFKSYDQLPEPRKRLFLCNLGAVKRRRGVRKCDNIHNTHAEICISPILPVTYNWKDSFDYRFQQGDFTPGPGRVLFLSNCDPLSRYEQESLGGDSYRCILSAGEPLTEWIGWFAFLRHAKGISAYCLRRKGSVRGECEHRKDTQRDPSTLLPDELASIFRDGYMDIGVLHTAYGLRMSLYKDTILVAFDGDDEWNQILKNLQGENNFIQIPLYQFPPDL